MGWGGGVSHLFTDTVTSFHPLLLMGLFVPLLARLDPHLLGLQLGHLPGGVLSPLLLHSQTLLTLLGTPEKRSVEGKG